MSAATCHNAKNNNNKVVAMVPHDQEFEEYITQVRTLRDQMALRFRKSLKEFADMMFGGDTKKALKYLFPNEYKDLASEAKGRVLKPKYRNPENPNETWSGRGRVPRWMERLMKERGMKKEDFLIRDQDEDL